MITPAVLLVLSLALSISAHQVHYVKPNETISDCNHTECLTLDQYTQQMATYFTRGSTFVFLTGNYSLQATINLTNISDISFRGEGNGSNINVKGKIKVAIFCKNVTKLNMEGLTFTSDEPDNWLTLLKFVDCREVSISNSSFHGYEETTQGVHFVCSVIAMINCFFNDLFYSLHGGALHSSDSNITIMGSLFSKNRVEHTGGAIYGYNSSISIIRSDFILNTAESSGGAIECKRCILTITGCNNFRNNSARDRYSLGGAIRVIDGSLVITNTSCTHFSRNEAVEGGAIFLHTSTGSLMGGITFEENSAYTGGAIAVHISSLLTDSELSFMSNKGHKKGGAISISTLSEIAFSSGDEPVLVAGFFFNNKAKYGGALFAEKREEKFTIENITATGNTESALWITDCTLTLNGPVSFINNSGTYGGGIFARNSLLSFTVSTLFDDNKALFGGAFYSLYGSASFSGNTSFIHNTANEDGGALHLIGTRISIKDNVKFTFSAAQTGGALYFESGSFFTLKKPTNLNMSHNYASRFGGAIYHQDTATPAQCRYTSSVQFQQLPYCFIQFHISKRFFITRLKFILKIFHVHSYNNSAGKEDSLLFGGLLDRCQLEFQRTSEFTTYDVVQNMTTAAAVKSKPYELCFCDENMEYTPKLCSYKSMSIYSGQSFTVTVIALGQGAYPTNTVITALLNPTARLKLNQSAQSLPKQCTSLTYNVYSRQKFEQMVLYPEGPCYDTGLARAIVNLTIKPCPDAFILSGEECVCNERLQKYGAKCIIDEEKHLIIKRADHKFWFSALYDNGNYQGLILCDTCPAQYCKTVNQTVTLDNPDIQCNTNRSGLLCGACATNYSLMLGSSRCGKCSNNYLALLLPFAVAGIVLVVFLSILRLTVATGMINSVILYANIVQANRNLFFPTNTVNVLTVFIAWLNLDLGLKTCFFDGLTAYAQTWLQFVFPIYVWILISLIILISRYSITVSKLIGHNPIAVLATLLLMSYTKMLKLLIDVYTYVKMDYPHGKTITMWQKDANVPYLQSWHLLLTVVTSLVLVFLFLPYTFLLLLGYKLYRFSGRKQFHWLNRIKPLLDSYYAPFKEHTRYWTGFLLLVRCALYVVFSFNSPKATIAALTLALTAIVSKAWLFGRIYEKLFLDIIESSIYFNLIILSTLAAANVYPIALLLLLIGIVFVTMIAIIVFQLLTLYTAKILQLLGTKLRTANSFKHIIFRFDKAPTGSGLSANSTPGSTAQNVSVSLVELREPLLDN